MNSPALIIATIVAGLILIGMIRIKFEDNRVFPAGIDIAIVIIGLFLAHRTAAGIAIVIIIAAVWSVWSYLAPPSIYDEI